MELKDGKVVATMDEMKILVNLVSGKRSGTAAGKGDKRSFNGQPLDVEPKDFEVVDVKGVPSIKVKDDRFKSRKSGGYPVVDIQDVLKQIEAKKTPFDTARNGVRFFRSSKNGVIIGENLAFWVAKKKPELFR